MVYMLLPAACGPFSSRFHLATPTSPEAKARSQPLFRPKTKIQATELDPAEARLFTGPHLSKGPHIKYDLCDGAHHHQETLGGAANSGFGIYFPWACASGESDVLMCSPLHCKHTCIICCVCVSYVNKGLLSRAFILKISSFEI